MISHSKKLFILEIDKFFQKKNLSLIDIFQVGSSLDKGNISLNDYDFLIIIEGQESREIYVELQCELREELKFALSYPEYDKNHFKLFDIKGLNEASHYDGFRVYEFKQKNISFYHSDIFHAISPIVNKVNFSNSLLIQLVYESLNFQSIPSLESIFEKIQKRYKRNKNIYQSVHGSDSINIQSIISSNIMLHRYWQHIFGDKKLSKNEMSEFLDSYFSLFKHEMINKRNIYNQINCVRYL